MISATQAWVDVLDEILNHGKEVESRNGICIELIDHHFEFSMINPYVTAKKRNINFKYVAAESLWTILGSNRLDFNDSLKKTLIQWSPTGNHLAGGYGPAFVLQMPYIVSTLRKSLGSRQAVMTIWERSPHFENDMPCMTTMQFLVRENVLDVIVTMRSSDAWLGLPNDMTVFTMMAACVMLEVGNKDLCLGRCFINAGSRHLYDKDLEEAGLIVGTRDTFEVPNFTPNKMTFPGFINWLSRAAKAETRDMAKSILFNGEEL